MTDRNINIKLNIIGQNLLQDLKAELKDIAARDLKIRIKVDMGQFNIQEQIEKQVSQVVKQLPTMLKREISNEAGFGKLIGKNSQTINQVVTEILSGSTVQSAVQKQNQALYEREIQEEIKSIRTQRAERLRFSQQLAPSSNINEPLDVQRRVNEYRLKTGQDISLLADRQRQLQASQEFQSKTAPQSPINQPELDAIRARKGQLSAQTLQLLNERQATKDFRDSANVLKTNKGADLFNRNLRLAQEDLKSNFGLDYLLGGEQKVTDLLARKYSLDPRVARTLVQNSNVGSFFSGERLGNKESITQIGFAGLFGGLPSLIGATAGATTQLGPQGAFLGSVIGQKVFGGVEENFKKLTATFEEASEAGRSFERSLLGISSIFQSLTRITVGGQSLPLNGQLAVQQELARQTQLSARSSLLPLGIAGQQEATFVQGIVAALGSRGFIASPEQVSKIAETLGGSIVTQRPQLLENTQLLLRDLQDLLGGGSLANRTVLSQLVRPAVSGIVQAQDTEGVVRALEVLKAFPEAAKNLDNPIAIFNRFRGTIDNLKTSAGDAVLKSIAPAFDELGKVIARPDFVQNITALVGAFGKLQAAAISTAAKLSQAALNLSKGAGGAGFTLGDAATGVGEAALLGLALRRPLGSAAATAARFLRFQALPFLGRAFSGFGGGPAGVAASLALPFLVQGGGQALNNFLFPPQTADQLFSQAFARNRQASAKSNILPEVSLRASLTRLGVFEGIQENIGQSTRSPATLVRELNTLFENFSGNKELFTRLGPGILEERIKARKAEGQLEAGTIPGFTLGGQIQLAELQKRISQENIEDRTRQRRIFLSQIDEAKKGGIVGSTLTEDERNRLKEVIGPSRANIFDAQEAQRGLRSDLELEQRKFKGATSPQEQLKSFEKIDLIQAKIANQQSIVNEELRKIRDVSQKIADPFKQVERLTDKAKENELQILADRIEGQKAEDQIVQGRLSGLKLQIDSSTPAGQVSGIALQAAQRFSELSRSGLGLTTDDTTTAARGVAAQGFLSQQLGQFQGIINIQQSFEKLQDTLQDFSLNMVDLVIKLRNANNALQDFLNISSREVRRGGVEEQGLSLAEAFIRAGGDEIELPAGISPRLVKGTASFNENDRSRFDRNLARSRLEQFDLENNFLRQSEKEAQQELELRTSAARAQLAVNRAPRILRDAFNSFNISQLGSFQQFAGTPLGDALRPGAIGALGDVQQALNAAGVPIPQSPGLDRLGFNSTSPEGIINTIQENAVKQQEIQQKVSTQLGQILEYIQNNSINIPQDIEDITQNSRQSLETLKGIQQALNF